MLLGGTYTLFMASSLATCTRARGEGGGTHHAVSLSSLPCGLASRQCGPVLGPSLLTVVWQSAPSMPAACNAAAGW